MKIEAIEMLFWLSGALFLGFLVALVLLRPRRVEPPVEVLRPGDAWAAKGWRR